jgi:hypothetical protein
MAFELGSAGCGASPVCERRGVPEARDDIHGYVYDIEGTPRNPPGHRATTPIPDPIRNVQSIGETATTSTR